MDRAANYFFQATGLVVGIIAVSPIIEAKWKKRKDNRSQTAEQVRDLLSAPLPAGLLREVMDITRG